MRKLLIVLVLAAGTMDLSTGASAEAAPDEDPILNPLPYPMIQPDGLPLEAELEVLRHQVRQYLREPERIQYANGTTSKWPLRRTVELATLIRDPGYVPLLHRILDENDDRYHVAQCLMAYAYPLTDERVEAHRGYAQHEGTCAITTREIATLLDAPPVPPPPVEALLARLRDAAREPAVDAFVRLIAAGIVPTLDDVRSVWPQLDETQRHAVLERAIEHDPLHRPIHVGKHRLRAFVTELAASNDETLDPDQLAIAAYRLGDHRMEPEIDDFIRRCGREPATDGMRKTPWFGWLGGLAQDPAPDMLDAFLEITSSTNRAVAGIAWQAISRTSSDDAHRAIHACLRDADESPYLKADVFRGFMYLARCRRPDRWAYLALTLDSFDAIGINDAVTPTQIDAFEALTGEDFGANGYVSPGGFFAERAAITVGRCRAWAVATPERIAALSQAMEQLGVQDWRPHDRPAPLIAEHLTAEQIAVADVADLKQRLAQLARMRSRLRRANTPEERAVRKQAEREWALILDRLRIDRDIPAMPAQFDRLTAEQIDAMGPAELKRRLGQLAPMRHQLRRSIVPHERDLLDQVEREWDHIIGRLHRQKRADQLL